MIKNYIKVALKVLKRNKLYTFISLFGISFTLMVLMLVSAVLQNELGSNPPLSKRDRILFVPSFKAVQFARETIVKLDTSYVDGKIKVDSTVTTKIREGEATNTSSSSLSFQMIREKLKPMKSPELMALFVDYLPVDVFPDGQKLRLNGCLTDADYWKIFDFKFIEGAPFGEQAIENQDKVMVIQQKAAEKYFGKQDSYLGKELVWGQNGAFKIIGVLNEVHSSNRAVISDFYVPISWHQEYRSIDEIFGDCLVALLAKSPSDVKKMEEELRAVEASIQPTEEFDRFRFLEKDATDIYAWTFMGSQETRAGGDFLKYVFLALGFFIIIPVLNLVNLNVTRIFERSSEIGVRKAFGAKTSDLLIQFLFENILLTVIGGIIGGILTLIALNILNTSEVFGSVRFSFRGTVWVISIFITFIFGLVSGFLPAWRVSRTAVASALKSGQL
ncbi:ABC transporter permease [Leadbetterella byssophila]|uniref:ABC transporter permease n=1 Tax=Leadbetterella byssophila TaxID=316068 RepID=UPI0039A1D784